MAAGGKRNMWAPPMSKSHAQRRLLLSVFLGYGFLAAARNLQILQYVDPIEDKAMNVTTKNRCPVRYSTEWHQSKRVGNIAISRDELDVQQKLLSVPLLQNIDDLLGQTVAWPNSRLVQSSDDLDYTHPTAPNRWLTRLAYAVIYHHQHFPVRSVLAASATTDECIEERNDAQGVGWWDRQCPLDQKFLVFSQQDQGIGAGVELFVQCLFAGIASQRIVLPINNIGHAGPWTMSSCPRRDMQCVFAPASPCVLTINEINNGTFITDRRGFFRLFRFGEMQEPDNNNPRVAWQAYKNFGLRLDKKNDLFLQRMYNISQELIKELPTSDDMTHSIWERTAQLFLSNETNLAIESIRKAAVLYTLRPNPTTGERLRMQLRKNLPQKGDFAPEKTIGIPIRATDKCEQESSCLSFEDYMELTLETWKQELPNESKPHVIVTSESEYIYTRLREIMKEGEGSTMYPLRFILNDGDVQPGSGRFREQKDKPNVTADDGMISALSTLQLQLGSGIIRANCCSKFHSMMGDIVSVGGGAALETDFQCLHSFEDPRFRICCWKTGACVDKRKKDLETWKQLHDASNVTPRP
mmetsp:Transcript_14085/g.33848  ORF Transcript_14085/g.33848 Transcript_14085/m.33848 type:complete len:582 (+) Transcript_14085:323-2068(+)